MTSNPSLDFGSSDIKHVLSLSRLDYSSNTLAIELDPTVSVVSESSFVSKLDLLYKNWISGLSF